GGRALPIAGGGLAASASPAARGACAPRRAGARCEAHVSLGFAGAAASHNQTLNNEAAHHFVLARAASSQGGAWAESLQDASLGHTVASLKDVAGDLQQDEAQEDSDVKSMEKQIVALVRKRDAEKKHAARKARELAFIRAEVSRLEAKSAARSRGSKAAAAADTAAGDSAAQDAAAAADGSAAGGQDTSDLGEA
ncbi:unnamed protein product, partial [Prorocentrum cordatum]